MNDGEIHVPGAAVIHSLEAPGQSSDIGPWPNCPCETAACDADNRTGARMSVPFRAGDADYRTAARLSEV